MRHNSIQFKNGLKSTFTGIWKVATIRITEVLRIVVAIESELC